MSQSDGAVTEAPQQEIVGAPPAQAPEAVDEEASGKRVLRSASRRRSRSKKLGAPRYETLVLVSGAMTAEEVEAVKKDVSALVESLGGSDVSATDLGRKRLAYRIGKQTDGIYLNFLYSAPTTIVAELDRDLKLKPAITRFLTTVADWSRT